MLSNIWSKKHVTGIEHEGNNYHITPIELSGIKLEQLLKENQLQIQNNQLHIKSSNPNFTVSTGKPLPKIRSKETKIKSVSHLSSNIPDTQLINNNNKLISRQSVRLGDEKVTLKTDAYYIKVILQVLNSLLENNINNEPLDTFLNQYMFEPMSTDLPYLKLNPLGDIHEYIDNKLKIRSNVFIREINMEKRYLLVGYPDYHKMASHLSDLDQDVLKRYQNNELENSNCKLLLKFFNQIQNQKFNEEDIQNQTNLWKLTDMEHSEILYMKKHFNAEYQRNIQEYKDSVHQYIKDNNILQQVPIRIKYIYHVFELKDNKLQICISSLYDLNKDNKELFQKVNNLIEENMYSYFLGQEKTTGKILINSFIRLTGFFHIESEFINPLSNHFIFSYMNFNVIQLSELIKTLQYDNFWQRLNHKIQVSSSKLTTYQTNNPIINTMSGGNIIDEKLITTLNNDSSKCHVILFNIDNLKNIDVIIELENRFIYMSLEGNSLKVDNISDFIEQMSQNSQLLMNLNENTYQLVKLLQNPYNINRLELVDESNKEDMYKMFMKDKIPIIPFKLSNQNLRVLSETSKFLPMYLKYLILYFYLHSKKDQENELLNEIIKFNNENTSIKKYKKNVIGDNIIRIDNSNYYGILYKRKDTYLIKDTSKYILWIISKTTYNSLELLISNIMETKKSVPIRMIAFKKYLEEITSINDDKYIRFLSDINSNNKDDVFKVVNEAKSKIYEWDGEQLLESFVHVVPFLSNDCLHIKFNTDNKYQPALEKDKYLNYYSRSINFDRIYNFLNVVSDYYSVKESDLTDIGLIIYVNIQWRFIFINNINNIKMLTQQSGGAGIITTKKIHSLPEFKKEIYKNIKGNDYTYDDYLKMINLIDLNLLVPNVDKFLDGKPNNDIYSLLHDFNKLTNIDKLHTGGLQIGVQINTIYNNGSMALITSNINPMRIIDKMSNSNSFDVFLNKGNLPMKQNKQFHEELDDMKVIENIYGGYDKKDEDTYPELMEKYKNSYNNVSIVNSSSAFTHFPVVFNVSELPRMFMKLVLGLSLLHNKGNMYIYMKVSFKYPLLVQYFDILNHVFDTVEYERLKFNRYNIAIHCQNFNRKKFEENEKDYKKIMKQMPEYIIDNKEYKDIQNGLYYKTKSTKENNADIAYKLKTKIPSSKKSEKLADSLETFYMDYINYIDYMMTLNMPLTEEKITYFMKNLVYEYVLDLVKFFEENKVPYNKYYLSLLDNYYEDIIRNIYSFTNNINVQLINYPKRSVSLKRSRSLTKNNRSTRTKSLNIKNPKEYLGKINGKNKPYSYEGFEPSIKKLEYVKRTRKDLMKQITNEKEFKKVTRIVEDFTRGISLYLHRRFKLNIMPSNAFTKLWEIYTQFDLVPNNKEIRMFHLAEAPGQFIKATEYYINKKCPKNEKYLWKANSLNPGNKEVTKEYGTALFRDDYGLIKKFKQNWIWGADNTGDITRSKNIKWYRQYLKEWAGKNRIDVITGDGGLELDRATVELQKLEYGQFLLAAATSSPGKHCIIKTFTPFMGNKKETVESGGFFVGLLFLYSLLYRNVYLVKPYTSRPTSGEYYIVGKNFVGLPDFALDKLLEILDNFKLNQTFFSKNVIPKRFVNQTIKFIEQMSDYNTQTIERQLFFVSCSQDNSKLVSNKTNCSYYLEPKNLMEIHQERYKKWVQIFKFR
jgi:hypothetical protein